MEHLSLDDCRFEGVNSRIFATGEPPKRDGSGNAVPRVAKRTGKAISDSTEIGIVTLRRTPLIHGDFAYSHIKVMAIEDATVTDTKFPHSEIGKLTLKNVKLSGTLDFSDTKVKEVTSENVTKDKLTIVRDKTTEVELSASAVDHLQTGFRKWLG